MGKLIGVVSDTHGLLRPEVLGRLEMCDHIVHAGDVGESFILNELRKIAPVTAVRGNVDRGAWAVGMRATECLELFGKKIFVLHDLGCFDLDPEAAGLDIVVFGHSHEPRARQEGKVWYLNPGSAGPKRFSLPVSMAYIRIDDDKVTPQIVEI